MSPADGVVARLWLVLPLALVVAPHALRLPPWLGMVWLLCAFASLHAARRRRDGSRGLKLLITLGGAIGVLLQFGTVIGPSGGVALLLFLSGVKLLEIGSARDRLGLLFVGCFLLVAHFLDEQSLPTAAYMMLAAVGLVAGLIAEQHATPMPRPTLALATRLMLQALPLAILLFVLFPRLPGPLWGLPQQGAASSGISDRMSPGDISRLTLSNEIAFRAEFNGPPPDARQLYWRGPVLWDYDGRVWQTRQPLAPATPTGSGLGEPLRYVVTLEPHRQRWLFLLGLPTRLPLADSTLGADLQWLARAPLTQRLRYEVEAWLDFRLETELPATSRARALDLPEGNPRAVELARQWAARSGSGRALVDQALAHFRAEAFFYTVNPPLLGEHAVDDFLFGERRGFCEHYASAFVFLMRAGGVPARVVTGYQGGELNPLGDYWIVRQRDAHAWAEVWLEGAGWVRIDPTAAVAPQRVEQGLFAALPADEQPVGLIRLGDAWLKPMRLTWDMLNNNWNQWVLGYNQSRQRQFLASLNPRLTDWRAMLWALALGAALILAGLAAAVLWQRDARAGDPALRAYQRFRRRLARRGLIAAASESPESYARRIAARRPDLAPAAWEITRLYLAARYGRDGTAGLARLWQAVKRFRPARTPPREDAAR